jgi:hypothetical protein
MKCFYFLKSKLKDNKFRNTEIIPESFSITQLKKIHYQEYLKYIIKEYLKYK